MSPLQEELINYYKQRLEFAEIEYQAALDSIQELKISHEETHKLSWEVFKRTKEVYSLQQALGDFQAAAFEERKHTLAIVAENDALKIQELKDRKKIRFLLSLSGSPEEEVTYFRDRLDKRLVKISRTQHGPRLEEQDLIILEDEVEGLKLTISSLQTQIEEQKATYEEAISGLMKERRLREDEEKARRDFEEEKIESLTKKLTQMRLLCRENTKELLRTKKLSHRNEKTLIEEKALLVDEIKKLNNLLNREKERNSNQEKNIEDRVSKEQQNLVFELSDKVHKLQQNLRKNDYEGYRTSTDKKLEYYKSKVDAANQKYHGINVSYMALKRRRDYEIEGFTSDILNLRQQLRTLEKSILKYGALEDKELILLNIGKL
ncbi:Coiled-coil domain-containing protein 77 [Boothiomyces sp. JEL0866]|nr:Coiled-coil domain-containing protein 77 [Boothiomyces sp. JEL0866]KAJ3322421.1 Coiled-coil domain-containing protein 77 [Boothiomyces sp. JEL0866]